MHEKGVHPLFRIGACPGWTCGYNTPLPDFSFRDRFMDKHLSSPLLSVIVPVYRVEPYWRKCLDSLVDQTYANPEIILVDDGSPDHCGAICDEYAKRDARIRVIHRENRGLSGARNAGLDLATGDYIGFVDSDDFIDESMYSRMVELALKNAADIVMCEFRIVTEKGLVANPDPPDPFLTTEQIREISCSEPSPVLSGTSFSRLFCSATSGFLKAPFSKT